jgi:hypothetical protein
MSYHPGVAQIDFLHGENYFRHYNEHFRLLKMTFRQQNFRNNTLLLLPALSSALFTPLAIKQKGTGIKF